MARLRVEVERRAKENMNVILTLWGRKPGGRPRRLTTAAAGFSLTAAFSFPLAVAADFEVVARLGAASGTAGVSSSSARLETSGVIWALPRVREVEVVERVGLLGGGREVVASLGALVVRDDGLMAVREGGLVRAGSGSASGILSFKAVVLMVESSAVARDLDLGLNNGTSGITSIASSTGAGASTVRPLDLGFCAGTEVVLSATSFIVVSSVVSVRDLDLYTVDSEASSVGLDLDVGFEELGVSAEVLFWVTSSIVESSEV